jgi:hypothetical protein
MSSSLARFLAMSQMGQTPGQNPLAAMIAMQQGMQPNVLSAPQQPMPPVPGVPAQQGPGMPRPQLPSGVPGVLSRFNASLMGTLAPNPGAQVEGLIGADAIKAAQSQSLLSLGASLLANSGYSTKPTTLGEVLGRGLQASQETYRTAIGDSVNGAVNAQNAASWEEQRRATAAASQELAQQRATERALNESIARARPQYAALLNGMEGLTGQQKYARYAEIQAKALAAGDTDTYNKLETSKNMLLQYAPKPGEITYRDDGRGRVLQFDAEGKLLGTYGERRPLPSSGGGGGDGGSSESGPSQFGMQGMLGRVDKKATEVQKSVESMEAQTQRLAATPNSGIEQIAVLYDFIKARDGSTVRDSERELLARANSLLGRFGLTVDRLRNGEVLTQRQVQEMMTILRSEITAKRTAYAKASRVDRGLLRNMGIDVTPYDDIFGDSSQPATPPAATPAPASVVQQPASRPFTLFRP